MDIFTTALEAVENFQSLTAGITWTALDELLAQQATVASAMDEFVKGRKAIAVAIDEHARQWKAVMDLANTYCPIYVEIAAMTTMPEPPRFEYSVPERVCPTIAWTPTLAREPDFDDEPNPRTIVRPEVKRRIGFRS